MRADVDLRLRSAEQVGHSCDTGTPGLREWFVCFNSCLESPRIPRGRTLRQRMDKRCLDAPRSTIGGFADALQTRARERKPKDRSLLRERSQVAAIERNELRRRLRGHRLSRHGGLAEAADRIVSNQNDYGRKDRGLHPHPSSFLTPDGGRGTTAATTSVKGWR